MTKDNEQIEQIINEQENVENLSQEEIEQSPSLEDKLKEIEEKYIRSLAEAENMRRRYEKMIADASKYAVSDFAKESISILDIFKKAFEGIKEEEITDASFKNFLVGIRLTQKQLEKTIIKFGIEKVGMIGEKFDPNWHEALYSKPCEDQENDTICEIIEEGYKIHDRLLRSAKVGIVRNS